MDPLAQFAMFPPPHPTSPRGICPSITFSRPKHAKFALANSPEPVKVHEGVRRHAAKKFPPFSFGQAKHSNARLEMREKPSIPPNTKISKHLATPKIIPWPTRPPGPPPSFDQPGPRV